MCALFLKNTSLTFSVFCPVVVHHHHLVLPHLLVRLLFRFFFFFFFCPPPYSRRNMRCGTHIVVLNAFTQSTCRSSCVSLCILFQLPVGDIRLAGLVGFVLRHCSVYGRYHASAQ
jgi:hypothetical protein